MYKVVVVDDEPAIREGLRTIVDWAQFGFIVVGDAADGNEALVQYKALSPDLIVIDIRMPGMDGLQVIQEIRKMDTSCHFLILSGYADFTYAKRAIEFGIDGYMLKPLDETELEEELKRISSMLDKESEWMLKSEKSSSLRREELLQAMFANEIVPNMNFENDFKPLLGLWGKTYQVVLIELEPGEEYGQSVLGAVKGKLVKAIEEHGLGYVFISSPHLGVLLKEDLSQHSLRNEMEQRISEAIGPKINYTATVGEAVRDLSDIRSSYLAALQVLKRSFMLTGQRIHWCRQEEVRGDGPTDMASPDLAVLAQNLYYALDIGSKEAVEEAIEEAGHIISGYSYSGEYIKTSFAQIVTFVLNKVSSLHHQIAIPDHIPMITELYKQTRFLDMIQLIKRHLLDLAYQLGNSSNVPVIKQITDFIQRHYSENLKLETLAEVFNYNSGYLGKLFKNYTEETFNTYLDKIRIQHAIELLGSSK